jgi:hypothetical protein
MKLRVSLVVALLAVAGSLVAATAAPAAPRSGTLVTSADGTTTTGLPVTGTFSISQFKKVGGAIEALGTFSGSVNGVAVPSQAAWTTVTSVDGHALGGAGTAAAPAANGTCQILSLTLGPLHLDVLGLVVDLNQVNLDITAQQGSGNLLGNLLCAVAGLLDNSGGSALNNLLQAVTQLLNQILGQL